MFKFRLDADDTFLILAPRWADLGAAWQIGLLALLLFAPLFLILGLYRYELRLIARLPACGLLMLRFLILLVILLAIGVQPHFAELRVDETPGRMRIAVDLSASMDAADQHRPSEEKSTLDRVLKLTSSDEAISRKQIVAKILSPDGMDLLKRLSDRHQVEIVGFHQQSMDLQPAQLLEILADTKRKQEVYATDFHQALTTISSSRQQPLLGVLLFSDGQHNVGAAPYDHADDMGKQRIPIFPIVIGSRAPPNDLAILAVQAKTEVFRDATLPVEIRCRVTSMPAQPMTVEMQIDGKPVRSEHRHIIQHKGKDEVYAVRFEAKMAEVGTHVLSLKAMSMEQKEITLANNITSRVVRVTDDKAKVLLVDGEVRWEYHYLANALLRDPMVSVDRVAFSQPRLGLIKDDQLTQAGFAKTQLPEPKAARKDYDPLFDYDCIVLGDVSPEQLPLVDRRRLEKFVAERGGTLILVAGKRYMPLAYAKVSVSPNERGTFDPLVKMLPITDVRELKTEIGFTLGLTGEGKLRPFLQLEPDRPTDPWPQLPKHYWGIVGKRKPAASVLLTPRLDMTEPTLKAEAETGIVLEQIYGAGRVVFVGLDSTWRWRYRVGDKYHHRFWGQLARWSAAEKLLPAGNRWIRYGSREPAYEEGQEVELAARLSESLPPLADVSVARAKLYRQNQDGTESLTATMPLLKHARQPNVLEASKLKLTPGTYRMVLDISPYRERLAEPSEEANGSAKGGDLFRILPRSQPELLDLTTNWTLMQNLAERSDGKLYTPETIEEILERLARRVERKEYRGESKPWQDTPMVWWMLGMFLGLLTLEWGWRKWLDLP